VSGKIRSVAGVTTTTAATDRCPRPLVGGHALFVSCLIFISSFIDRQIVGAPTDHAFQDPKATKYSIAIVGAVSASLMLLLLSLGRRPCRDSRRTAQAWQGAPA
jgi:tetrahydromethanopterin S-methyltransferase subunit D